MGFISLKQRCKQSGGVSSINRAGATAVNGNDSNILESVEDSGEFGLFWMGFVAAGDTITFNSNAAIASNNATQMFSFGYLGDLRIK